MAVPVSGAPASLPFTITGLLEAWRRAWSRKTDDMTVVVCNVGAGPRAAWRDACGGLCSSM